MESVCEVSTGAVSLTSTNRASHFILGGTRAGAGYKKEFPLRNPAFGWPAASEFQWQPKFHARSCTRFWSCKLAHLGDRTHFPRSCNLILAALGAFIYQPYPSITLIHPLPRFLGMATDFLPSGSSTDLTQTSPTMASPTRSIFGSLKDKLSKKSRSRSPSPNPFGTQPSTNPFATASSRGAPASADNKDQPPPPPYSEVAANNPTITVQGPGPARAHSPAASASSARSDPSITSPEDPYAFLSSFDTVFLIDDSGSMAGRSWREVKEALRAIAPICTAHDDNGIDVYFLNARSGADPDGAGGYRNIRGPDQVEYLFNHVRPAGGTPTGTRINQILKPYLRHYEKQVARTGNPDDCGVKPVNMIVITDGVPTDDPEAVIVSIAKKLDRLEAPPHQVGIQFFQVGRELGAAEALRELDDGLAQQGGGVRDMVDTATWDGRDGAAHALSADAILKVVLGAVVRRLDRRNNARLSGESRRSRNHLAP